MESNCAKSGVYIIGVSDCGESVCAAAGRISTQQGTALEIYRRSYKNEKNETLIRRVTASGHTSTVEHIYFNLAFENVSVALEQFMIEFRLASFTVKSRRYVDFGECGYYVPSCLDGERLQKYRALMDDLFNEYSCFVERGVPKEDARFLLPYCFKSNFYCSLNGRELLLVIRRMLFGAGSEIEEIKQAGLSLYEQAKKIAPGVFSGLDAAPEPKPDRASPVLRMPDTADGEGSSKPLTELLSFTPDAPRVIAETWLTGSGEYAENVHALARDKENVKNIISAAAASSRPRCLESASFTFKINNVSLSCITHFARHRMQSLLVPPLNTSDRLSYIVPQTVARDSELLESYTEAFNKTHRLYCELKAAGIGESGLVYCLLSGNTLDIVATMNARELLLFFSLRTCMRAQWEIRELADDMLFKLRELYPEIFMLYGPSCCTQDSCPEGRLSCGKAREMRERFLS